MPDTTKVLLTGQATTWQRILDHPFVAETSAGTLPRTSFDRWLVEDHYFVVSFRAFLTALTEVAPDRTARDVLAGGLAALTPELELFETEAAARGLDLTAEPSLLNLGYSSYLQACVNAGWPVGITVLYAAEKAYYDAWASVRDSTGPDTPYVGFIANWSSPEFAAYVDQLGALVDREELTDELQVAFGRVARFEIAFWDLITQQE